MLSPEIWNFTAPKSNIVHKSVSDEDVIRCVKRQLFNHHVSITIPNAMNIPQAVTDTLTVDAQYYRVNKVPITEIFNETFVDFFKNGQVTACSVNTISNEDDILAYVANGRLILNLNTKTAQEIGIHSVKFNTQNLIVLDIISLFENKKKFTDVQHKLSHKNLQFDIILAWEPNDIKICPSSIAQYFSQKSYNVKTCDIKVQQRVSYNVPVPIFDEDTNIDDFYEWLGSFNLQCNMSAESTFISSLSYLEKMETFGQVCHLQFTGFFSTSRIERLINLILQSGKSKTSGWIGVVINGFAGGLLSTKNGCSFQPIGDHHSAIIVKSDRPTLVSFFSTKCDL